MKKQLFLLVILMFAGVFFSSLKDKEAKACDINSAACSAIKKIKECKAVPGYEEDADASFNMFMNPFRQI